MEHEETHEEALTLTEARESYFLKKRFDFAEALRMHRKRYTVPSNRIIDIREIKSLYDNYVSQQCY